MATAECSPENGSRRSLRVGVCAPAGFPQSLLRGVLARGGHAPVFWQEAPDSALEELGKAKVGLFLLGAQRVGGETCEHIAAAYAASPTTKVIVVCDRSGQRDTRKALDAGANGLVALEEVEDALLPVIEVVRAGQVSVPSAARSEAGGKVLTAREKQILGQVVLGMSNAEIAAKLFLAESTVKSHLSSAFAKLGVASRNEAAALILDPAGGLGLGILTIPTEKLAAPGRG